MTFNHLEMCNKMYKILSKSLPLTGTFLRRVHTVSVETKAPAVFQQKGAASFWARGVLVGLARRCVKAMRF